MTPLLVRGMGGLGDCLHQRAIVRQLLTRHEVWLQTPWPSLYHDLAVHLLPLQTTLRTQRKNMERESYACELPPAAAATLSVSYRPDDCRRTGVFPAMCKACGCDAATADFSLPIAPAWKLSAARLLRQWSPRKPLLLYRPLVERTEWAGCRSRNPDPSAYARLLEAVRRDFFVVSVADLIPGVENMVSEAVAADVELHAGELDVGTLAALCAEAALVFCSPGFGIIMAQAVGTPTVCVFGGYESAQRYVDTALYAPFLGINPRNPCNCYRFDHRCDKAIDVPAALPELRRFALASRRGFNATSRPTVQVEPRFHLVKPPRFFNAGELDVLMTLLARVRPSIVLEFGVNDGATARTILEYLPSVRHYVGVDVEPAYVPALPAQRGEVPQNPGHLAQNDPRFGLLLRPRGSHDLEPDDLPLCDAVFIDGDHSRAGVLHDTMLAKARLRPGGIIVWHDDHALRTVQVRETLDELHAYGEATAVHVDGTWLAFEVAP